MRWTIFFIKEFLINAIRITLHRQGSIAKMWQKDGRDPDVVVDHLAFAEPDFRVENLVQVRNREIFSFNDEFRFVWHGGAKVQCMAHLRKLPRRTHVSGRRLLACSRRQLADEIVFLGSARVSRAGDDVSSSRTSEKIVLTRRGNEHARR